MKTQPRTSKLPSKNPIIQDTHQKNEDSVATKINAFFDGVHKILSWGNILESDRERLIYARYVFAFIATVCFIFGTVFLLDRHPEIAYTNPDSHSVRPGEEPPYVAVPTEGFEANFIGDARDGVGNYWISTNCTTEDPPTYTKDKCILKISDGRYVAPTETTKYLKFPDVGWESQSYFIENCTKNTDQKNPCGYCNTLTTGGFSTGTWTLPTDLSIIGRHARQLKISDDDYWEQNGYGNILGQFGAFGSISGWNISRATLCTIETPIEMSYFKNDLRYTENL